MKLAHVSYEFPPDTAVGGIATYVYQVSRAMRGRGHAVEVFCGSPCRESLSERFENDVLVHRIHSVDRDDFRREVVGPFAARHAAMSFDLLESPEYGADGLLIRQSFPDLPTVVRCHTPGYFVRRLNKTFRASGWKERIKGALHLGQYQKHRDREYQLAMLADCVSSPSVSLREHLTNDSALGHDRIDVVPYVFIPQGGLLDIPATTDNRVVTFLGRLEVRKGVVALSDAIPQILRRHPEVVFRFVGKGYAAPRGRRSMLEYLQTKLAPHLANIEMVDHVPLSQVANYFARTDICVFPSLWENFPNVCLEAMSAAHGIVASCEGGMQDMLADIDGGILIEPTSSGQLADAVIELLDQPQRRQQMGSRCRAKIVDHYAAEVVSVTERYYADAIAKSHGRCAPAVRTAA